MAALAEEDSVRVKVRVLEQMAERGLSLGDIKGKVQLPTGWSTDPKGVPRKAQAKAGVATIQQGIAGLKKGSDQLAKAQRQLIAISKQNPFAS